MKRVNAALQLGLEARLSPAGVSENLPIAFRVCTQRKLGTESVDFVQGRRPENARGRPDEPERPLRKTDLHLKLT